MPGENVSLLRTWMDATARQDLATMLEIADPGIELRPIMAVLEGRVYSGHEGVAEWMRDLFEHWETFRPIGEEFHERGDTVIAFGRWQARGRVSGAELDGQAATWVVRFRDGRMTWLRTYTTRAEALEELDVEDLP